MYNPELKTVYEPPWHIGWQAVWFLTAYSRKHRFEFDSRAHKDWLAEDLLHQLNIVRRLCTANSNSSGTGLSKKYYVGHSEVSAPSFGVGSDVDRWARKFRRVALNMAESHSH